MSNLHWSIFWVILSIFFGMGIWVFSGSEKAIQFFTAYLVEKTLSLDNLFVFLMLFKDWHVPPYAQHTILRWGIIGAFFFRGLLIWIGLRLLEAMHFLFVIFGAVLIFGAFKLWSRKPLQIRKAETWFMNGVLHWFPHFPKEEWRHWCVNLKAGWSPTPLLIVTVFVELTDFVFAIDSLPAVLGITQDPFLVYSSNILAICGLRSLYFVLADQLNRFTMLHYGLALILGFIGCKMIISPFFEIPPIIALGVTLLILAWVWLYQKIFPRHTPSK